MEEKRLGGPWIDEDGNYHPTTQFVPKHNIFEGAKFGDKFRTRDGKIAIFVRNMGNHYTHPYRLVIEGFWNFFNYDEYGRMSPIEMVSDIVSRWEEPIDEEELDKLADIASHKVVNDIYKNFGFQTAAQVVDYLNELYKAGYHKAKGL